MPKQVQSAKVRKSAPARNMSTMFYNRNISRTLLITVLIAQCSNYCDLVYGKMSQINYGRHPFELRTAFPSSPRPPIIFYSGNTTLSFSASNINPKGFDFSKLHAQQANPQNVAIDEKSTVIPLAWVNLPLFDTPTFSVFSVPTPRPTPQQYHSNETRQVQNSDSSSLPQPSRDEMPSFFRSSTITNSTDNGASESRSSRAQVVKSDWDGRTKNEIADGNAAENDKIPNLKSFTTDRSSTTTPTYNPPEPPQLPLERRIQLSNRGGERKIGESESAILTVISGRQGIQTRENNEGLPVHRSGEEDHSVSESRTRQEKITGSSSNTENRFATKPASAILATGVEITQREKESRFSPPVAVPETLSPHSSTLSFGVPTQRHQPQQNYQHQNMPSDYRYDYAVSKSHSHSEMRTGDRTEGQYSVLEPNGWTRIVSYTADAVNGFRAMVRRVKV